MVRVYPLVQQLVAFCGFTAAWHAVNPRILGGQLVPWGSSRFNQLWGRGIRGFFLMRLGYESLYPEEEVGLVL